MAKDVPTLLTEAVGAIVTELTGTAGVTGVGAHDPSPEGTPGFAVVEFTDAEGPRLIEVRVNYETPSDRGHAGTGGVA